MTRNVRMIAKGPETHLFPVSILEALMVVAIQVIWLLVSLTVY